MDAVIAAEPWCQIRADWNRRRVGATYRFRNLQGMTRMDEETKVLLRNIAHHLKWVIVLLVAILGLLIAQSLG